MGHFAHLACPGRPLKRELQAIFYGFPLGYFLFFVGKTGHSGGIPGKANRGERAVAFPPHHHHHTLTVSDSSSDADSSSDGTKNKSKKKKSKKDDDESVDDKLTTKAESKARKENKIPKLTQSAGEAQKGMLDMATELRELRGLPEAIQKQSEEQQKQTTGNDDDVPEPLLTMSQ